MSRPHPFVDFFAHLPPASQCINQGFSAGRPVVFPSPLSVGFFAPHPALPALPVHSVPPGRIPAHPTHSVPPGRIPAHPASSPTKRRVAVVFVDSKAGHYQILLSNKNGRNLELLSHTTYHGQSRGDCARIILSQVGLPNQHMKHFDITDHATSISTRVFVYHARGLSCTAMTHSLDRTHTSGSMRRIDAFVGIGAGIIQDTSRAVFNIDSNLAEALRYVSANIHHLI